MSFNNDSFNNSNSMNLLLQPMKNESLFDFLENKKYQPKMQNYFIPNSTYTKESKFNNNFNNNNNFIFVNEEVDPNIFQPEKQKSLKFFLSKKNSKKHDNIFKSRTISDLVNSLDQKISLKKLNNLQNMRNLFKVNQPKIDEERELRENKKNNRLIFDEENLNMSEEIDINELYYDVIMSEKPIQNSNKIPLCSVLKYGTKPSIDKIEYTFCKTCDNNLINPICIECINNCHKNHHYKKEFLKGNIKCFCGENLHKINDNNNDNIDIIPCTFNEFSYISKLNIYYVNENLENICIFCHNFCSKKEKDKIAKLNNNNNFFKCECKNEQNHCEYKRLLEKINKISFLDLDVFNFLHPIQKLNLIFLSKNSFNDTYKDFIHLISLHSENFIFNEIFNYSLNNIDNFIFNLFISNFTETNCYLSLKIFENFTNANKKTGLRYYTKELENFFTFEILKNFFNFQKIIDNISFWSLHQKIVHLFHKIYIGNKTQKIDKYKIYDLENFSCFQRLSLFQSNVSIFPESKEIITFLLKKIESITSLGFSNPEAYNLISEIFSVIKKLSIFNLISNGDMMRICLEIEKLFVIFSLIRNSINKKEANPISFSSANLNSFWMKESKFFLIIMKMLRYFIFTYNDRLIFNIVCNKEKFPNLESINNNNCLFIFNKTELGRLISRISLRVTNILKNHYNEKINTNEYIKIMRNSMKIFEYFLGEKDDYLVNLEKNLHNGKFYILNVLNVDVNNKKYKIFCDEKDKIENVFMKFFSIEICFDDVLETINNSLDIIFNNNDFNQNDLMLIVKSKYFFSLSKTFDIKNLKAKKINENNENNEKKHKKIFDRIFLFFNKFVENSSDNSLLVLNEYVFKSLTNAPIFYGKNNFDLFFKCLKFIEKNDKIISFSSHYIKNLFEYLNELNENKYDKIKYCLFVFFKCLDSLILNTKTLNIEKTIYKTQFYIKKINAKFQIHNAFAKHVDDNNYYYQNGENNNENKNDFENNIENNNESNIENNKESNIENKNENNIENKNENINENTDKKNNESENNNKKNNESENNNKNNNESENNNKNNENNTNSTEYACEIFLIYLKIINSIFDFAIEYEKEIAISLIDIPLLISQLKYLYIPIRVRTEILRFIRKVFIDMEYIKSNKEIYSYSIISSEDKLNYIKSNEFLTNFDYPTKYLSFMQEIYNSEVKDNNDKKFKGNCIDYRVYDILLYEIENVPIISRNCVNNGDAFNYFENGLLIPVIYFLKKCFYIANIISGKECLDIYNLIYLSIKLKTFIASFNVNFWQEEEDIVNEINKNDKFIPEYYQKFVKIDGNFCVDKNLIDEGEKDCKKTEDFKFNSFDYTTLYLIAEKHLFSLIKDFPVPKISKNFKNFSMVLNLVNLQKIESNYIYNIDQKSEIERRLIRIYFLYKLGKVSLNNENNSCIFSCLAEICLEFETNFRNLFVEILIYNGMKKGKNYQFSKISFYLLFKLLSLQTTETQEDIINLLGGLDSEDLSFMNSYKNELFKRLILLFIEFINPYDKLVSLNYILSYNLIKIFKNLCEEHNNFFQGHLIKTLSIDYYDFVPNYVIYNKNINNNFYNSEDENSIESLGEKVEIKFFYFFLHVLSKIILISKWNNLNNEDISHTNEFLYDLFAAILEMLIEIIQGNKPEFLSRIGNPQLNIEKINLNKTHLNVDISNINENNNSNNNFNNIDSTDSWDLEEITVSTKDSFQIFVSGVIEIIFNNDVTLEFSFIIRNHLMQFFTAILEEKNCNEEVQKFLIKNFSIHKILRSICLILKSYYLETCYSNNFNTDLLDSINDDDENNNNLNKEIDLGKTIVDGFNLKPNNQFISDFFANLKNLKFEHKLYNFFKEEYFKSNDFSKSNEFELSNNFYKYIKLIAVQGKSEEISDLIKKINKIKESEAIKKFKNKKKHKNKKKKIEIGNLMIEDMKKYDSNFVENFYIIKFFESITETVEVRTEDINNRNSIVIFTKLPDIQYLSKDTKNEFEKNVKRTSETSKKNDLVEHIDLFIKEIKYNKKIKSKIQMWFNSIDYYYIQMFSYFYALFINIFMILTLKGDTQITNLNTLEERRKDENKIIKKLIEKSIEKWANYYNILIYLFVAFNAIGIAIWVYFRMPLYYRLDTIIYMQENKINDKKKLNFYDKIKIALMKSIWERDHISSLIFEFIISLIGAILKRGEIIYPFMLLAILDLNMDLHNIIISIKTKYKELGLTFVLMILIMYVFSNVAFFFFNEDFKAELDYFEDNYCESLIFCFLTTTDSGLRARGGLGDSGERISFARFPFHYVGRIITDDLFFFIIIIIMIDLVFGIVIESFDALGIKEQKQKNDKTNHCFICHVNKATVEKNRENFDEHREKNHNLWNYVDYMIFLKFSEIHDLNATNSYSREKLDNKDISWLPSYKDVCLRDEDKKKDENEENLSIAEENIIKYCVKEQ